MRVLLVQPPLDPATSRLSALGLAEPLGLEYVGGALLEHDVRLLDLRIEGSLEEAVASFDPELIGTSAVTATLKSALGLLGQAKRLSPGAKTVIGGVHATLMPEDCKDTAVDFIVQGDGEHTMADLVCTLSGGDALDAVAGLIFRDGDTWRHNGLRPPSPLDDYPLPARSLTAALRDSYSRVGLGSLVSAISSRGCTRRCTFCSVWAFHHGKYRKRSCEKIIEELVARPEQVVDFVDDDSFSDLKHMDRLQQLVASELPGRTFKLYVRADSVVRAPELFERWAASGLRFVLIGLEAFRDRELQDLNKRISAAQNKQALEILNRIKVGVIGYMIARPDYTEDDFKWLGDTVEELGIAQPIFGTLTPFPGTVLYEQNKDSLVTRDWDLFDGFHAVTPTRLPLREYYHHLAELYRRAYSGFPTPPGSTPWYEHVALAVEGFAE